jgi:zinc transporter
VIVVEAPASGVICSFRFEHGRPTPLSDPDLAPPSRGSGWTWSHFRLSDVRAMALLHGMEDLPAEAAEHFAASEDRVQIAEADGWAYGVLPDFERDLQGKPQGPGRLVFAFDASRLITARLHPLLAADELRHVVQSGELFHSPAEAIVAHIQLYTDHLEAQLDEAGRLMASVEDYVLTQPQNPRDTELSGLRRTVARHRRELQSLRTAMVRAHAGRRHGRRVAALRDEFVDLIAAVEDLDHDAGVLQDRGRLLHEEIDTLINGATNRSMRALTIISTLLIPPTLVTGAFGMNVPGIPFEHSPSGFLVAAAMCAVVVAGALVVIRRMGM